MADVFGELGGQPIELNNAATEATLKQLVQAVGILAAKTGKGAKSQAELEKELKKFHDQLGKTSKATTKQIKDLEDEQKKRKALSEQIAKEEAAREKAEKRTIAGINAVRGFTDALEGGVTRLTSLMSQLAGMGNSFTSAAGVFNNIPLVGGLLGGVFGAVAQSGDRVFTTFKQAASVGANFNGSIRDLVNAASGAGLTMDQFSGIIQKNGENLAFMGGSATEGAKQLANAGKQIRNSRVGDDLARLGYSTEDISNGMARFGGMMARSGKQLNQDQLVKSTADYLKQLDAVARLTGKNKDALQAEADARMADSQYRLMLAKLDPEGAANLEALMASIPKEHQAGLKEILATGTAVSDEAVAAMAFMNKTGHSAQQLGETMRRTGTLTKEQMFAFDDARRNEMKMLAEEARTRGGAIDTVGNFGDAVQQKLVVGVLDAASQTGTLRTAVAQQTTELGKAAQAQKDAMDPAAMQRLQQSIAETSNKMTMLLAENLPKLASAFDQLMKIVNDYVVPAFRWLMNNFETVVGVIVAFKGAMMLATAAAKAMELYRNVAGPGTNPAKPMFVKEIGAGVGAGGALEGAADGKGRGRGARGLVRGLGAAGAVVSAGMLVSDLSDISEQERSGQITGAQATEARGGAVGGAVGGAGGAFAGAAAGAAVGSVVPIVGTVIGGAIGAALGGWLGSKGGEVAGKELTKAVTASPKTGSEDWLKVNNNNIDSWVEAVYAGRNKIEEVPGVYLPYVKERLAKKPVRATNTAGGGVAVTIPRSTGGQPATPQVANFNTTDPSALYRTAQSMYGVPNTPATQTVSSSEATRRALENKAAEEAAAAKKAVEEQQARAGGGSTGSTTPGANPLVTTGTRESVESLLSSLNNKLDQLIKINREVHFVNERQLSVQQGLTSDLFASI